MIQKATDFAPVEQVIESPPVQNAAPASNAATTSAVASAATTSAVEQFSEANYKANYAHNPKPDYPSIAKSRGWQGKVMLRVLVSAEGAGLSVAVDQSSGHEALDESAVEAVRRWRFIPAKRGETPVASSVLVPIVFKLRN